MLAIYFLAIDILVVILERQGVVETPEHPPGLIYVLSLKSYVIYQMYRFQVYVPITNVARSCACKFYVHVITQALVDRSRF